MTIKVCGMREPENIREIEQSRPDMMGFIFYPASPRYIERIPSYMPAEIERIGVFVNAEADTIFRHIKEYGLDGVQLHGNESPKLCALLQKTDIKVIKTVSVSEHQDIGTAEKYQDVCDLLLFDTSCKGHGGSGKRFDWSVLAGYEGKVPFLLSGGITPDSLDDIGSFSHPAFAGIDLNSGFESAPGLKDADAVRNFISNLRQL